MGFVLSVLAPLMLSLMMVGLGFSLTLQDFGLAIRRKRALAIGLLAHTVGLPLIAAALIWSLSPPLNVAFGILILACCSGGTTASVFTHLSGGDTALSIALSLAGKLLSVVTIPLFVGFAAHLLLLRGAPVALSILDVAKQIVELVVLPVAIGMGARAVAPKLSQSLQGTVNKVSLTLLLLFAVLVTYNARAHLASLAGSAGLISVLLFGLATGAGYGLARVSGLSLPERKAILFHTAVQNSTFAAVLAVNAFHSEEIAVPAIVYTVIMNLGGLLVVRIMRSRAAKREQTSPVVLPADPVSPERR
jgi:BASS family bile acid:Na+ symporter